MENIEMRWMDVDEICKYVHTLFENEFGNPIRLAGYTEYRSDNGIVYLYDDGNVSVDIVGDIQEIDNALYKIDAEVWNMRCRLRRKCMWLMPLFGILTVCFLVLFVMMFPEGSCLSGLLSALIFLVMCAFAYMFHGYFMKFLHLRK